MRSRSRRVSLRLLALASTASWVVLGGCGPGTSGDSGADQAVSPDGTVVILVMDGVRLEESLGNELSSATGEHPSAFLPRLWSELVPQGLRSTDAWNLAATITVPAHASLLTGRRVPLANYASSDDPGQYRSSLPTMGELLRGQEPELSKHGALLVGNTTLLEPLGYGLWPGLGAERASEVVFVSTDDDPSEPAHTDAGVVRVLLDQLEEHPVRLALANLHQVDRSGHFGESGEHLERVRSLDEPILDVWRWLQNHPGYAGDGWLLVVSDHGRHSAADTDPPWRHHGCACNGCRRLPFLLLGPEVREGEDGEEPVLLVDVAPTLGAVLGLEIPWATGLVRDDWFDSPTGFPSRAGLADLALAGEHRAELSYLQDPAHRYELAVDGVRVSSADAVAVEAPVLTAVDERAYLCFREVLLEPDADETIWEARCLESGDGGASWDPIGFPLERVGPYWRPALAVDDAGSLVVAWGHNPNGLAKDSDATGESDMSVDLARFDGGSWQRASSGGIHSFPQDAALALAEGGAWVAVGAGAVGQGARHTRDIRLGWVALSDDGPSWSEMSAAGLDALANGDPGWRLEYPALRLDGDGRLHLAASGFHEGGTLAVVASSDDGRSWDERGTVDLPYELMPHLGPVWIGERALWATVNVATQDAWLCAGEPGIEPICVDAGTQRISRLAVAQDELHALVDVGVGQWEASSWPLSEFGGR